MSEDPCKRVLEEIDATLKKEIEAGFLPPYLKLLFMELRRKIKGAL